MIYMKGFTLPELLITIAIIVIISAAAIPIYGNLQVKSQINESTSLIIQTIRTAKEKSMVRVNSSGHGVWFAADSFTLYAGSSYTGRDTDYDRRQEVDPSVTIATTLPGGEINFSKSFGEPDSVGDITLTHDTGEVRVIDINSLGVVEEE
jgi:prepilin-type N-terminal cleavage/methylation domain-containing protein